MSCTVAVLFTGDRAELQPSESLLTLTTCSRPPPGSASPNTPIENVFCMSTMDIHPDEPPTAVAISPPESSPGAPPIVFTASRSAIASHYLSSSTPELCSALTSTPPLPLPPHSSHPSSIVVSPCGTALCLLFEDSPTMSVFIIGDNGGLEPWSDISSPASSLPVTSVSFVTLDTDTLILLASSSNGKCLEAFDVKTLTPLLAEPYMDSGASPNSSICLISSIKLTATSALIATATDASEITLHKLHLHSSLHISTLAAVTLPSPSPLILATSFFSSHLGLNRALAMGAELGSPDPTNLHLCIATSTTTSFSLDCCTNQLSPLRLLADLPADHLYARASVRFPSVYKASAFLNVTTFERVALAEAALPPPPASVLKPTSLLATSPPPKQSPLSRVQPPLKETQNVMKSTSSASSTIRTQSSGYGATQPQMKMGVAPSAAKKQHKQLLLKRKKQQQEMLQTRSATVYPTDCDTLTCHQEKHDYLLGEDVPVAHVKFHPLSTHLAIVKMDHSVEVKQLPFGGNKRAPIQIDGQARGAGQHPSVPGFAGNLLAYDDAVYDVTKAPKSGSTSLPPVLRIEGATQLCFYYNTKFLLSVSGKNVVKMHAFGGASGVSRTEVASFAHGSSITALQAVNSGLSNLVFTAGADRSLRVIDVNTGADCWAVPNAAGGRKVGCLALPGVYPSAALPAESYNLIAASSTDQGGLINLWDVRAASPAALFKGHVNRVSVSGVAFSPCMRYVSVGSEDVGGACSYDLRMGGGRGVSWRCKEGRGVKEGAVVAVEYNPIFPQLCTATLGGVVKFYNSS